ncbi:hypothetical protein BMT54_06600 [Pasteurellaceae bacterium 15-036681]|nr:hypothetical protein BMT54_06600 [Pasteurellaceae bacterium 15-036681]
MSSIFNKIERSHITFVINSLVAIFFLVLLAIPKGYSYSPMILGGTSTIYLIVYLFVFKKKWITDKDDKLIIFSFVFYFLTFLIATIYHGDSFREIDNPSRILLFIPLILLFSQFPIKFNWLVHAVPVGAAIAGIVALYQKFYLKTYQVFSEHMHIQAGDISVTLAMCSLAIAIYWKTQRKYSFMVLAMVCVVLGITSSALTGARGGWVAIPFVLATILVINYKQLNKKLISVLILFVVVISAAVTFIPQTGVMKRIDAAQKDITLYMEKNYKSSSLGARFDMWENAWLGIKDKPLLGWGNKGYQELKKSQVEAKTMAETTLQFNDSHNQYLDSLVKRGVFGFLGLLFILVIPFRYFLNSLQSASVEAKCISTLGILNIVATMSYFLSQTFLAHNSGSIFYFFLTIILYCSVKQCKQ